MPIEVTLNIYDLVEQTPICCGFFHTGVEIFGVEYSFAQGAGIHEGRPREAQEGRFREGIVLGTVERTDVARAALDRVRPDFGGDSYSLIFKNCNDFSSAYCRALLGRDIPGYVNRLARLGRSWPIRCFLPPHLKAGQPNGDRAPLLSTQQGGAVQTPLFTGSGHSLTAGSGSTSGGSGGLLGGLFARGSGSGAAQSATNTAVVQASDRQARELRASAAAKRLSGAEASSDLESGQAQGAAVPKKASGSTSAKADDVDRE
mmetsp:Transcript_66867/g.160074  ORF Transcript_66867/g.160074 Transcript_66867/m.160074 type:complete len:260 (-) Transcript_66867:179-958(-)